MIPIRDEQKLILDERKLIPNLGNELTVRCRGHSNTVREHDFAQGINVHQLYKKGRVDDNIGLVRW